MERSRWIAAAVLAGVVFGCIASGCSNESSPAGTQTQTSQAGMAADPHSGRHFVVRPLDAGNPATTIAEVTPPGRGANPAIGPAPESASSGSPRSAWQPESDNPALAPDPSIAPIPSSVNAVFNPLRIEQAHVPIRSAPPVADNPLRMNTLAGFADSPLRSPRSFSAAPPIDFPVGEATPPAAAGDPPPDLSPPDPAPTSTMPPETTSATEAEPAGSSFEPESPALAEPPSSAPSSAGPEMPRAAAPSAPGPRAASPQPLRSAPSGASPPIGAFDVVQVFYGTDRRAVEPSASSLPEQMSRYLPTAISVLITLSLALIALGKRRPAVLFLACLGALVSLGLGYQAATGTLAAVRRSGHAGPLYTSERSQSGQVQLGICEVTIPKTHQIGELEAPSILRLEVKPDADKHVILSKTERLADDRFYELLRSRVAASPRKELFVFVHGFNVTFEDAARRTAQIQKDLSYEGAPIFFSWPAHDKFILTYKADEANVSWSVAHLKQFLLDVTRESKAESINLIAHSMGNRALTAALKELQLELRDESRLFNQVILAAPDIDADEFRESIVPGMTRTANRFTLYASARDEALAASQLVHRGARAGDAGRGLVVVDGIDTIDVTQIDTSAFGHTYYGSSDPVLRDLGLLITRSVPPEQRVWLAAAKLNGRPYWIFQPASTATARVPSGTGF